MWFSNVSKTALNILRSPRIGIAYAGPDWATRPYRFSGGRLSRMFLFV